MMGLLSDAQMSLQILFVFCLEIRELMLHRMDFLNVLSRQLLKFLFVDFEGLPPNPSTPLCSMGQNVQRVLQILLNRPK